MNPVTLQAAVEAILYVADDPVTLDSLRAAFPGVEPAGLEAALERLGRLYEGDDRGVALRRVAGGWRLSTRVEVHDHVRGFLRARPEFRLSMAALETLAIVAYRQPVTAAEVLHIRGVKSSGALRTLLEKRLVVPRGRRRVLGAPMQYGTGREFLLQFGLESLRDLPALEEFEELFGERVGAFRQRDLFATKDEGVGAVAIGPAPPGAGSGVPAGGGR